MTSLKDAFLMLLRGVETPLGVVADPFYNEQNLQALQESISEADRGEFAAESTASGFAELIERL